MADGINGIAGVDKGVGERRGVRDIVLIVDLFHVPSEVVQRFDGLVEDGGIVGLLRGGGGLRGDGVGGGWTGGGHGGQEGQRDTVGGRHCGAV